MTIYEIENYTYPVVFPQGDGTFAVFDCDRQFIPSENWSQIIDPTKSEIITNKLTLEKNCEYDVGILVERIDSIYIGLQISRLNSSGEYVSLNHFAPSFPNKRIRANIIHTYEDKISSLKNDKKIFYFLHPAQFFSEGHSAPLREALCNKFPFAVISDNNKNRYYHLVPPEIRKELFDLDPRDIFVYNIIEQKIKKYCLEDQVISTAVSSNLTTIAALTDKDKVYVVDI